MQTDRMSSWIPCVSNSSAAREGASSSNLENYCHEPVAFIVLRMLRRRRGRELWLKQKHCWAQLHCLFKRRNFQRLCACRETGPPCYFLERYLCLNCSQLPHFQFDQCSCSYTFSSLWASQQLSLSHPILRTREHQIGKVVSYASPYSDRIVWCLAALRNQQLEVFQRHRWVECSRLVWSIYQVSGRYRGPILLKAIHSYQKYHL